MVHTGARSRQNILEFVVVEAHLPNAVVDHRGIRVQHALRTEVILDSGLELLHRGRGDRVLRLRRQHESHKRLEAKCTRLGRARTKQGASHGVDGSVRGLASRTAHFLD